MVKVIRCSKHCKTQTMGKQIAVNSNQLTNNREFIEIHKKNLRELLFIVANTHNTRFNEFIYFVGRYFLCLFVFVFSLDFLCTQLNWVAFWKALWTKKRLLLVWMRASEQKRRDEIKKGWGKNRLVSKCNQSAFQWIVRGLCIVWFYTQRKTEN